MPMTRNYIKQEGLAVASIARDDPSLRLHALQLAVRSRMHSAH